MKMPGIFGKNKLLAMVKCAAIFAAFGIAMIIIFLVLKKSDPKIPQVEVIINLKIDDNSSGNARK